MADVFESSPKIGGTLAANIPDKPASAIPKEDRLNVDFDNLLFVRDTLLDVTDVDKNQLKYEVKRLGFENRLSPVYQNVVGRIYRETNFFKQMEETGMLFDILLATQLEKVGKTTVSWGNKNVPETWAGLYNPPTKEIMMKGYPEGSGSMLTEFALEGQFPLGTQYFAHEMAHKDQHDLTLWEKLYNQYAKYRSFLNPSMQDKNELKEMHAFRVGQKPSGNTSKAELVKFIAQNYPGSNVDKLIYSIDAVDKLLALGIDPQEVARVVGAPGPWDEKRWDYPRIQRKIASKMKEKNLSENDLESLVMADKLEREIQSLKVMQIAQEEIKRALFVPQAA